MFLSSKLLSRGMLTPYRMIPTSQPTFQLLVHKNQLIVNTSYQSRLFIQRSDMFSTNALKQITEKCHSLENVPKVNEITMEQVPTTMSIKEKKPKLSKTKKSETDNKKNVATPKKRRTISSYKEENEFLKKKNEFLKKKIEDINAKLDNIQVKVNEENMPGSSQKPEEPNNTFESEQSKIGDSIAENPELNHHTSGQEKLISTNSDITNLNNNKVKSNDKKKKKIKTKEDNSNMSDDLSDLDFNAIPSWPFDPVVAPLLSYAGSRQGLWTRKPYYYYDFMIMISLVFDTLAIYIKHDTCSIFLNYISHILK